MLEKPAHAFQFRYLTENFKSNVTYDICSALLHMLIVIKVGIPPPVDYILYQISSKKYISF